MSRQSWTVAAVMVVAAAVAACDQSPRYSYKSNRAGGTAAEQELPPAPARVVPVHEAEQSGLTGRPLAIPFAGGRDGTELVAQFFQEADRARAQMISELAIILETTQDGRPVECRTEIVPESITETQLRPGQYKTVSVQRPVQRTVTEQQYRCKPVMRSEMRSHTEYEQRCGSVMRPVQRTRTVYSTQYDSFSKSSRSVPRTEYYTAYESHYECKSQPVTRMRSEMVSRSECGYEPVTRTVTRYEFQLESQYVPPHMETLTRQRLRELDPVCYEIEAAADDPSLAPPTRARGSRIEGRIFTKR